MSTQLNTSTEELNRDPDHAGAQWCAILTYMSLCCLFVNLTYMTCLLVQLGEAQAVLAVDPGRRRVGRGRLVQLPPVT